MERVDKESYPSATVKSQKQEEECWKTKKQMEAIWSYPLG